ncbi:glycosyl transferase [Sphingomonas sp. DBB INV C78]|uniref:glycosyltransferase family 4 protein n=1 Tax=Sphingomonas sp. DBB INV C78 TaxID=3349434 RepID=UPI0036D3F84B
MRIVIVTDAWAPQVNGVVRTLQSVGAEMEAMGHEIAFVSPDMFPSMPCPTYPEIRLAFALAVQVGRKIAGHAPDAVHIATEGPLGLAARRWCLRHGIAFTTAYHTQFPDYVARRTGVPAEWIWRYIRWFHAPSAAVLASTVTVRRTLEAHGVANVRPWGRGVDLALFRPDAPPHPAFAGLPRPIQLYVGRVAVEKNVEAFLAVDRPGTKVVVGDGPLLPTLKRQHPAILFLGPLSGEALAGAYAGADVFVFPSRTDTFGLVMIEALASGTPVAAYPVIGPVDVLDSRSGAMAEELDAAIGAALLLDRAGAAAHGRSFGWRESAEQFLAALVPAGWAAEAA